MKRAMVASVVVLTLTLYAGAQTSPPPAPPPPAPPPGPTRAAQPPTAVQPSAGGNVSVQPISITPAAPGRPQPAGDEGQLKGEAKLRWILQRLQLTPEQTTQANALITVYNAELDEAKANQADFLRRVQDKLAEIKAAQQDGNQEKVKQLQAEMQQMTPQVAAESNFFNSLEQTLTAEQRAKLPRLREQVLRANDLTLRPAHVLAIVHKLRPTADQLRKLEDVLDTYRKNWLADRPRDASAIEERVEGLVRNVRELLTPEQAAEFDKQVEATRLDPPAPTPVTGGSNGQ